MISCGTVLVGNIVMIGGDSNTETEPLSCWVDCSHWLHRKSNWQVDFLSIGPVPISAIWIKNNKFPSRKRIRKMSFSKCGYFVSMLLSNQVLWSQHIGIRPEQVANCDDIGPESDLPNFLLVHLTYHTSVEIIESLTRTDGEIRRNWAWKGFYLFPFISIRPLNQSISR